MEKGILKFKMIKGHLKKPSRKWSYQASWTGSHSWSERGEGRQAGNAPGLQAGAQQASPNPAKHTSLSPCNSPPAIPRLDYLCNLPRALRYLWDYHLRSHTLTVMFCGCSFMHFLSLEKLESWSPGAQHRFVECILNEIAFLVTLTPALA